MTANVRGIVLEFVIEPFNWPWLWTAAKSGLNVDSSESNHRVVAGNRLVGFDVNHYATPGSAINEKAEEAMAARTLSAANGVSPVCTVLAFSWI
jgi:hypothetical protein